MFSRVSAAVAVGLALSACVHQPEGIWTKPGASQDDFSKDRYACMQQSQQPNSVAYFNRYGGGANSSVITNGNLFGACMNASGWYLAQVTDPKQFNDAISAAMSDVLQLCAQKDLQPIFAKKTPFKPKDATPDQPSDRSKITNPEKIALMKWRSALEEDNNKIAAIHRQFEPQKGNSIASVIDTSTDASVSSLRSPMTGRSLG